jgi:hypothetical protein
MHTDTQSNDSGLARICAGGMALAAGLIRLIPHPLNFTPIDALGLFGGARLRSWWAYALPIGVMAVSDLLLWALHGSQPFNPWVYGCFCLAVVWGRLFLRSGGVGRLAAVSVLVSVQFFLVTNFGVWLHMVRNNPPLPEGIAVVWKEYPGLPAPVPVGYAANLSGLLACYAAALPFAGTNAPPFGFFGNQLLGDVFYTALLFGVYGFLLVPSRRLALGRETVHS